MRSAWLLAPLAIAAVALPWSFWRADATAAQAPHPSPPEGAPTPSTALATSPPGAAGGEPSAGAAGKAPSLAQAPQGRGLLASPEDFAALREALKQDPLLAAWHRQLQSKAQGLLRQAPIPPRGNSFYPVQEGSRRLLLLAGLHRLQANPAYAARAKRELLAMVAWPHWWPELGLLLGETTEAVAIGLDWLRPELSPAEVAQVKAAIATKGLAVMEADYHSARPAWSYKVNNWNHVVNSGAILGALAIAPSRPALARAVLADARDSLTHAVQPLPDGSTREGPNYWAYGMNHAAIALAALEEAGVPDALAWFRPGLAHTGWFRLHTTAPSGLGFNLGDNGEGLDPAPAMLYFAKRFQQPAFADAERALKHEEIGFLHLLWGAQAPHDGPAPALNRAFFDAGIATLRGAWGDPKAGYVGLRGGSTQWRHAHSHLDLGSFVYESQGVRWAIDLGKDNYALPGYFGLERFTHTRLSTAGHNLLRFGRANQQVPAWAPLLGLDDQPGEARATVDLREPNGEACSAHERSVALLKGRDLEVVDRLVLRRPTELTWQMHTRATVALAGAEATLSQGGQRLKARILEAQGATWRAEALRLAPPQEPTPGVTRLAFQLKPQEGPLRLVVRLEAL